MAQNNATSGNYPLIRYSSPISLQVLASAKIATNLWRHKIDTLDSRDEAMPWSWIDEGRTHLLPVPSAISGLIENALKIMLKRILAWVQKYSRTVFQWREERDVVAQIFYDVEVDDDDIITAKRLLSCDSVTPEEKYKIACVFCLEEGVVRLWPSVDGDSRISEVTFEENKIIYYWNCMMKEVPVEVPGNANDSIHFRMISQRYLSYPSIMYFWGKLTNEERISILDSVFTLDINYEEKIMTNLLPQLNHIEARRILENFPIKIISTLARNGCMECVVQVWTYFCQFASAHLQFEVLSSLYKLAYLMLNPYAREPPKYECYRVSEVVYELWTRSPDPLKTYVTDNFVEYAFENLTDVDMIAGNIPEFYGRDMRFLLELLGRVDLKTRNRLWCENWLQLIIIAEPEYLDQFMKLCFETDEQIVRFKEGKMMDYDEVDVELQAFVDFELFDELSELIRFCSNDPTRVENLRRRIIASRFSLAILSNQKKCQNFVKFIDDTFESVEQAGLFKEEFLTSHECEMLKQVYANLDKGCIKNMINIRHFLYSKTRTDAIKQECLSHCKQCLVETKFMNFDVNDWKTFVFWCCETRSNWWAFRRSLPVNQILEKLLAKVIRGFARLEGQGVNKTQVRYSEINNPTYEILLSFVPVDNFLLWLYVKQDIVNKYKEAKLKNRSSKVIITILRKNWGPIVDVLLMWFFNNDKQRVEEFKTSIGSDASTSAEA